MTGTLFQGDVPLIWPDTGLKPHRFAGIFRMLSPEEKTLLDASVREKGVKERIWIYEDAVLDGRNRYLSAVDTERFNPSDETWQSRPDLFREFTGTPAEALDLVWTLNEERRHDEKGERAMAAARRKKLLDELAAADPSIETRTDAQLAVEHGVSERLLNSANKVVEHAEPEVKAAVDEKRMSVTDAAIVAGFDKVTQSILAQYPDKKTTKRKVKEAQAPKLPNMPELPSPLSRTALSTFAEEAILLALAAAKKHKGPGASISADAILGMAVKHDIVEDGAKGHGFTRPMLLVLGRLRDTMPGKAPKPEKEDGPTVPPLGGEWSIKIGGLKGKGHSASIAVFHEEDGTFSISVNHHFGTRGGNEPFAGSHATFRDAQVAAGNRLATVLDELAGSDDSVTTAAEKDSAHAGLTWLEKKFAEWGLPRPEPKVPDLLDAPAETPAETYARLVAAQGNLKGNHTRETAKEIILAAEAADIRISTVEADIGHSRGTIGGWRNKLGLQKSDRNPSLGHREEGAAA